MLLYNLWKKILNYNFNLIIFAYCRKYYNILYNLLFILFYKINKINIIGNNYNILLLFINIII